MNAPTFLKMDVQGTTLGLWVFNKKQNPERPTAHLNSDGTPKTYFAHTASPSTGYTGFGTEYPALSTTLPTSVTIDDVEVALKHVRPESYTKGKGDDKVTVIIPEHERRDSAVFDGQVTLPSTGDERHVSVKITVTKAGTWNVRVLVTKHSPVSPEEREAKAKAAADTRAAKNLAAQQAAMAAIFAAASAKPQQPLFASA